MNLAIKFNGAGFVTNYEQTLPSVFTALDSLSQGADTVPSRGLQTSASLILFVFRNKIFKFRKIRVFDPLEPPRKDRRSGGISAQIFMTFVTPKS
jgi:hypothetical protein